MTEKKTENRGYVPLKKGYRPGDSPATAGHKPEKSELAKPVNPPKKK